jgi:tight adherence protein C
LIVINIVVLLTTIGLYIAARMRYEKGQDKPEGREHRLYFLYPMAELILSFTGLNKYLQPGIEITNSISALHVTSKPERQGRLYLLNKVALSITIITLFNLLSLLGQLGPNETPQLRDGRYIERPDSGEGSKEIELEVTLEDTQGADSGENNSLSRSISLEVEERRYTPEEVEQLFEEGKAYLEVYVLGTNHQTEEIQDKLVFFDSIPDTGITVKWKPEDPSLIAGDGTVKNEQLLNAVNTGVTAILSYEKQSTTLYIPLTIIPKNMKEEERLEQKLKKELLSAQEMSKSEKELTLPKRIDSYILNWKERKASNGWTYLLLGTIAAIALWYAKDMELNKQMKLRQNQLLLDYPEIINKFTLLVNAGMTVRQAWFKITEDYQEKKNLGDTKHHYAYEEMLVTAHELRLGASESNAYESYGRRVGLIPYIRFVSLVSQNLKKGSRGFTELLRKEAMEAFEDRKEIARRLGEEAGTKLLAPMMLLLIIVFLIIMIPAFMAFRI